MVVEVGMVAVVVGVMEGGETRLSSTLAGESDGPRPLPAVLLGPAQTRQSLLCPLSFGYICRVPTNLSVLFAEFRPICFGLICHIPPKKYLVLSTVIQPIGLTFYG